MDTPLVIFALIAVVAMGMMVFADSTMTGQGISIDRLVINGFFITLLL